jgi:hypothetical protein
MKLNRLLPLLWVVPLAITALGCPTRTVRTDASDGGSVDSSSDRGAASGAGGMSGASGNGGASGAAGAAETGGALGTGGASGAGGVSGAGGMSGAGGNVGAAGVGVSTGSGGSGGSGGGTGGTSVRDGQPCSLPKDCTSGACSPFYVDVDGDGYGAGQAVGFCGTTPPVGYAAQSGDCCDSAPNLTIAKLIHPGADFQSTSAGGTCISPGTTTAAAPSRATRNPL